jgi:DNA-binding HxlR family transcriptional regulator
VEYDLFASDCPARTTIELVSNRWSVVLVHALGDGPLRFGALQRRIGGISPKSLNDAIRRLEHNGLVERAGDAWALTRLGATLRQPIATLAEWAITNTDAILDAQTRDNASRSATGC